MGETAAKKRIKMRHHGRGFQVLIYLGKIIRIFFFQNDWKVLPMSAIVAGMASLVVRAGMFQSMERTLTGSLALTCVAIWNGFFNSIQVICRERNIIKREHRSGLHMSSYVAAHMLFQAVLCALQSGITIYVCTLVDIHFPAEGLITRYYIADLGITLFLVTYAADMTSLFISSIVRTTTAAMTVMPFILIFQLVFSGGVFALPRSIESLSYLTISHYGLQSITAQSGYNDLPMQSAWETLNKMKNSEVDAKVTLDDLVTILKTNKNASLEELRNMELDSGVTVGEVMSILTDLPEYMEYAGDTIQVKFKISDVIDIIGEEKAKGLVDEKSKAAGQNPNYDRTVDNVLHCWRMLIVMIVFMSLASVIALEFIDKDKR